MHYFFNALSFALPIILLMSDGIQIHYPLLFNWVMEFESITQVWDLLLILERTVTVKLWKNYYKW